MRNIIPNLLLLKDGEKISICFQHIKLHMVSYVKMDFTRKSPLVDGRHMNETPDSLDYFSVVSRYSVKTAFILVALNYLDVFACDIGKLYLKAPCRKRIWTTFGPEFGDREG